MAKNKVAPFSGHGVVRCTLMIKKSVKVNENFSQIYSEAPSTLIWPTLYKYIYVSSIFGRIK